MRNKNHRSKSSSSSNSSSSSYSSSSSSSERSRSKIKSKSRSKSDKNSLKNKSVQIKPKDKENIQHVNDSSKHQNLCCVYIENLSQNVNENHLNEIFSIYGKVIKIFKYKDINSSKRKKLSALIQFEKLEEAENAHKCLNGGQIDGLCVKLDVHVLSDKEVEKYMICNRIELILKERQSVLKQEKEPSSNSIQEKERINPVKKQSPYNKRRQDRYKRSRSRSRSHSNSIRRHYSKRKNSSSSSSSSSSRSSNSNS